MRRSTRGSATAAAAAWPPRRSRRTALHAASEARVCRRRIRASVVLADLPGRPARCALEDGARREECSMAQAAPAPGGRSRTRRTPDLFGERTHAVARMALPVVLGLVYGYWAAANRRAGGPITGWNILFGFVTAVAFIVVFLAVQALAPRMKREQHALLWTAFVGC